MIRLLCMTLATLLFPLLIGAQSTQAVKTQDEEMRAYMVVISRQLGATCTSCHNISNFKADNKREFKVAKEHIRLTQLLIDSGMDGKKAPKADCYMCHRGKIMPDYKEKLHPMQK